MATQRYISTSFWDDPWVCTLNNSEKLTYLYLMTNTLTNIAGVYEITNRRMCFDIGIDNDDLIVILKRFEDDGKFYKWKQYAILPTWPKHQKWDKKIMIRDGIVSVLQDIPEGLISFLDEVDYQFDLSLIETTIIASKQRRGISGTTKKKLYEKHSSKCSSCGISEKLEVHHIISLKEGGNNRFDNLDLLCGECHKDIHSPNRLKGLKTESKAVHSYSDLNSDIDIDLNLEVNNSGIMDKAIKKLSEDKKVNE